MAPHSSTLAWKIPWTEESGGLQSMGSLRVGHNWMTLLSLFIFTFHFHALEKEMATHSCSCLENPRDGGAWWAAVYGVAQSRTRLKWLSSSSSSSLAEKGGECKLVGLIAKQKNRKKKQIKKTTKVLIWALDVVPGTEDLFLKILDQPRHICRKERFIFPCSALPMPGLPPLPLPPPICAISGYCTSVYFLGLLVFPSHLFLYF